MKITNDSNSSNKEMTLTASSTGTTTSEGFYTIDYGTSMDVYTGTWSMCSKTGDILKILEIFCIPLYQRYNNNIIKNLKEEDFLEIKFLTLKVINYLETTWREYGKD